MAWVRCGDGKYNCLSECEEDVIGGVVDARSQPYSLNAETCQTSSRGDYIHRDPEAQ